MGGQIYKNTVSALELRLPKIILGSTGSGFATLQK